MNRTRETRAAPVSGALLAAIPLAAAGLALALLAGRAQGQAGQVTFSVDWHGPTIGMPDSFSGTPILESDVLTPVTLMPSAGPLPPPGIWISGGFGPPVPGLGIPTHPPCIGKPPGTLCPAELDALSFGMDRLLQMNEPPGVIWFSTDEYATCLPGMGFPAPPNILTEGPVAPIFADEATADAWVDLGLPPGPIPPFPIGPIIGHVGAIDGDGLPSASGAAYPGLGLFEPLPPTFSPLDPGDTLDALSVVSIGAAPQFPVWYSLDAAFPDPLGYPNEGTAPANGFFPGDVLVSWGPGGPPVVFAPSMALGLDRLAGPETDDLDALLLAENGSGAFEPSLQPYDWVGGQTDLLLFSVRRGSAVIGAPDSIFGAPIEEGDILTTPLVGGLSPFPGIFYPAEALGLATVRSGMPGSVTQLGDELDALSSPMAMPLFDCNGNGLEDAVDIGFGTSTDVNSNGVPDDCEVIATPYCFGVGCPCANDDPSAGCINFTGVGALLSASGSSSVANDDMVLTAGPMRTNQPGLYYFGPNQISLPFGNGLRCIGGGAIGVRRMPVRNSGAVGAISEGPGIVAWSLTLPNPSFHIAAGSVWNFQCWFRDPGGPCGASFNFSNALAVTFTP